MSWKLFSKEEYFDKSLVNKKDFSFIKKKSSVPLTLFELSECVGHLPILFEKKAEGFRPLALMGLNPQENLLINESGSWRLHFVPSHIDVYPFRLANIGTEKKALAILEGTNLIVSGQQENRLYNEDGSGSDLLVKYIKLLHRIESNETVMEKACCLLTELSLLKKADIKIPELGFIDVQIEGFFVIDVKAFENLSDENFRKLRQSNALHLIYAHLFSMTNLSKLVTLKQVQSRTSANLEDLGSKIFADNSEEIDFGV